MKIQLTFGNGTEILDNVVSFDKKKSLVSGLMYVTVRFYRSGERTFSNVYDVKVV